MTYEQLQKWLQQPGITLISHSEIAELIEIAEKHVREECENQQLSASYKRGRNESKNR